jgi:hypothetical protein
MIHDAYAFRGEYIDLCAHVERWATGMLRSEAAAKTGRVDAKLPYLFGDYIPCKHGVIEA